MKSTVEEIRRRFDKDVERFSNLQTGQSAAIDAPVMMELIAKAAAAINPEATHLLDIGCGAGNYSLKLLQYLPGLNIDLVDLSQSMLNRASERTAGETTGKIMTIQADIRRLSLERERYDVITAAAVLHHLRTHDEWKQVSKKIYHALKPGGSFWISDLITHSTSAIQKMMWQRYGKYLEELKDKDYRDQVFSYIEKEDTPRPLIYQLDLLQDTGFSVEILHKNSNFAAFGGIKAN